MASIEQANTAGWAQELVQACLEAPAGGQLDGNTRFKFILSAKAVFKAILEAMPAGFSVLERRRAAPGSDAAVHAMLVVTGQNRLAAGCRALLMRAHSILQFLAGPLEAAPQLDSASSWPRSRGRSGSSSSGDGGGATAREQQLAASMLLPTPSVRLFIDIMQRYMLAPQTHLQGEEEGGSAGQILYCASSKCAMWVVAIKVRL
jgi:hypothetical protein